METINKIEGLFQKPLWQMTGEEYCQLTHYALSLSPNTGSSQAPTVQKALGIHALAVELGCSDSTVYSLMRTPLKKSAPGLYGWPTYYINSMTGNSIVRTRKSAMLPMVSMTGESTELIVAAAVE